MTKRTLVLSVVAMMALFSCKKDDSAPAGAAVAPSKMDLLTRKQWIYNEIYNYYHGDSTTARLLYKRGLSVDVHRDSERDIFWKSGQRDALFDNDSSRENGTWFFSADSSHYTYVTSAGVPAHATILVLDSTHFTYWDLDNNVLGEMTAKY